VVFFGVAFTVKGFEPFNATLRWSVACPRLDGDNSIIFP